MYHRVPFLHTTLSQLLLYEIHCRSGLWDFLLLLPKLMYLQKL